MLPNSSAGMIAGPRSGVGASGGQRNSIVVGLEFQADTRQASQAIQQLTEQSKKLEEANSKAAQALSQPHPVMDVRDRNRGMIFGPQGPIDLNKKPDPKPQPAWHEGLKGQFMDAAAQVAVWVHSMAKMAELTKSIAALGESGKAASVELYELQSKIPVIGGAVSEVTSTAIGMMDRYKHDSRSRQMMEGGMFAVPAYGWIADTQDENMTTEDWLLNFTVGRRIGKPIRENETYKHIKEEFRHDFLGEKRKKQVKTYDNLYKDVSERHAQWAKEMQEIRERTTDKYRTDNIERESRFSSMRRQVFDPTNTTDMDVSDYLTPTAERLIMEKRLRDAQNGNGKALILSGRMKDYVPLGGPDSHSFYGGQYQYGKYMGDDSRRLQMQALHDEAQKARRGDVYASAVEQDAKIRLKNIQGGLPGDLDKLGIATSELSKSSERMVKDPAASQIELQRDILNTQSQLAEATARIGQYEKEINQTREAGLTLAQRQHDVRQRDLDQQKQYLTFLREDESKAKGAAESYGAGDIESKNSFVRAARMMKDVGFERLPQSYKSLVLSNPITAEEARKQARDSTMGDTDYQDVLRMYGKRDHQALERERVRVEGEIKVKVEIDQRALLKDMEKVMQEWEKNMKDIIAKAKITEAAKMEIEQAQHRTMSSK